MTSYALTKRPFTRPALFLITAVLLLLATLLWQLLAAPAAPPPAPALAGRDRIVGTTITDLQARVAQNPNDAEGYAMLGLAYLQQVRETADANYYGLAEQAFNEALSREPQQFQAVLGQGILALARHDFQQGLVWGEQASTLNPYSAEALGVLVDANVELGRYETAVSTAQQMVNLRPNLASYSRIAYLRELHGDVDGAIVAMGQAAQAGAPGQEDTLWTLVQLGNLYLNRGEWGEATAVYQQALQSRPDYPFAQAGLARVQAAQGNVAGAIETFEQLVGRLPLPEFAITLGELYLATDQPEKAQAQFDLVHLIQQLNADAGMDVDLELALFEANHGDPAQAVRLATAAYDRRPSIYAADALSWSLYKNGDPEAAWPYAQEALHLGTQDAMLHFHAGMIAQRLGRTADAQTHPGQALALNATFSIPAILSLTKANGSDGEVGCGLMVTNGRFLQPPRPLSNPATAQCKQTAVSDTSVKKSKPTVSHTGANQR
ncbi:MAG: tetratricopeptide repeat protein [Chloroflexota bacterium]